jgi:hypothetical protein
MRDRANKLFRLASKLGLLSILLGLMGPVPATAQVETTTRVSGIVGPNWGCRTCGFGYGQE